MIILFVCIYSLFTILQSINLFKKKQKKELMLYLPMMLINIILIILIMMKIELPNPAGVIENLVDIIIE